jgi:hypothetical protein
MTDETPAPDDMRPEYDFSRASASGRHRHLSASDPWYPQAVEADQARWLAEAMLQVQQLERELVTYFALSRDEEVGAAGHRAIKLLESRGRGLARLGTDLARRGAVPPDLLDRLRRLTEERTWLVHGSFLTSEEDGGVKAGRLRRIAHEAERLAGELAALLRSRFVDSEMSAAEFSRRTEAVRREWPRAA